MSEKDPTNTIRIIPDVNSSVWIFLSITFAGKLANTLHGDFEENLDNINVNMEQQSWGPEHFDHSGISEVCMETRLRLVQSLAALGCVGQWLSDCRALGDSILEVAFGSTLGTNAEAAQLYSLGHREAAPMPSTTHEAQTHSYR